MDVAVILLYMDVIVRSSGYRVTNIIRLDREELMHTFYEHEGLDAFWLKLHERLQCI